MSVSTPLLDTIEPDEPTVAPTGNIASKNTTPRAPVVLTPTSHNTQRMATTEGDAESGISGIFRQSAHPLALFFLYFFRVAAITVYILCGFFTDNYVLSTVIVVVLLAMDFWNCRNVAGRTLVGLRFWNQVDDDGESYWVFESRDPSRPANPIDSKMFWIALYSFPLLWTALLIVSLLKLGFAFIPIVGLALVFNFTNAIGFTYAYGTRIITTP
ncbi:Golgi apparatus membrane protein tvp23 [Termitomyces sp. Mn162]|nr:Golgi apparatus membrane protein tvp23 [Termitomyces sp. Mn162]